MNSRNGLVPPLRGTNDPNSKYTYKPAKESNAATIHAIKNQNGDLPESWNIPLDVAKIPDPTILATKSTMVENNPR